MSAVDRILSSLESLTALFTRNVPQAFVWSYSVEAATETSFSGRAVSPDCPFADMPEIPIMPGIAGAGVRPAVGSIALVAFVDGDPAKPRVVGWDQQVPESITIDARGVIHLAPTLTGTVQVGDDSAPGAQAVALAPAVDTFATASTTLATATTAFTTALSVIIPIPAPTPPQLSAFATAATTYTAALTAFSSAVGALAGTWPTGFAATKTSTK